MQPVLAPSQLELLVAFVEPSVELVHAHLDAVIKARTGHFKDTTPLPVLARFQALFSAASRTSLSHWRRRQSLSSSQVKSQMSTRSQRARLDHVRARLRAIRAALHSTCASFLQVSLTAIPPDMPPRARKTLYAHSLRTSALRELLRFAVQQPAHFAPGLRLVSRLLSSLLLLSKQDEDELGRCEHLVALFANERRPLSSGGYSVHLHADGNVGVASAHSPLVALMRSLVHTAPGTRLRACLVRVCAQLGEVGGGRVAALVWQTVGAYGVELLERLRLCEAAADEMQHQQQQQQQQLSICVGQTPMDVDAQAPTPATTLNGVIEQVMANEADASAASALTPGESANTTTNANNNNNNNNNDHEASIYDTESFLDEATQAVNGGSHDTINDEDNSKTTTAVICSEDLAVTTATTAKMVESSQKQHQQQQTLPRSASFTIAKSSLPNPIGPRRSADSTSVWVCALILLSYIFGHTFHPFKIDVHRQNEMFNSVFHLTIHF